MAEKPKTGVRVLPSPFNPVKMETALILLGAFVAWAMVAWVFKRTDWELPSLALYSLLGALWLWWRTRGILRQQLKNHGPG